VSVGTVSLGPGDDAEGIVRRVEQALDAVRGRA
jgi:hypothetical protein